MSKNNGVTSNFPSLKITILKCALVEDVVKVVFDVRSVAIGKHLKIFIGYKSHNSF